MFIHGECLGQRVGGMSSNIRVDMSIRAEPRGQAPAPRAA